LGADRLIGGMNLSGDNAYSFTGNTLTLGVGGNFITSNPSTGSVTHTISSAVSLDGTAVINTASNAGLEIGGGVSGSQAVTKSGAGTLTLTGASSYSGTLTVSEGTLAMGKHNDASTSGGSLNAATIINNSAVFTALNGAFSGNMSGSGSWTVQGRNSSLGGIYTGAATHTGGTTISTSSLTLGDGGTSGSVTGNFTLVNGGLLTINHSDAVTLAGTISGDGEVWNGDTGALSLTGAVSVNVLASSSSGALHVSSTCAATNGYIGIGSTGSSLNGNSSAAQMTFTYLSIGTAGSAAVNLSGGADLTTGDIEFGSTGDGIGSLSLINSGTSLTCTGGITGTATSSIRIRGGSTLTTASLTSVPVSMDTFGTLVFSAATTCDSAFTLGIAGGYLSNAVAVTLSGPINGPLSKAGSGTLTLTGTNSLTDSLVIDAGTLTLSSISISDSADVYIAAAATLNLNFTGTDTVNQLSIGTVQQSAGTWGSLTSSATHKTARITGNGILLVTNGPDDFTDWAAQYGLTLTEADFDLDSDNDGIDNGLEFVLGGNPATSDTAAQPITSSVSGGYHTLTFHRYDGSERDINLDVEYSTNLTTWTPIIIGSSSSTSGGVIITVTENGSSMDLITVQMPVGVNTRMFSRIFAEVD
ncbi:MAG: autotransporter-associated beta strand repeat-containing protein, partial [Verrucomicrobia bacterium]|nr:autotransporter-associated beta strand repeat-containing protein [Verrucomicrobiota bacterium]